MLVHSSRLSFPNGIVRICGTVISPALQCFQEAFTINLLSFVDLLALQPCVLTALYRQDTIRTRRQKL